MKPIREGEKYYKIVRLKSYGKKTNSVISGNKSI